MFSLASISVNPLDQTNVPKSSYPPSLLIHGKRGKHPNATDIGIALMLVCTKINSNMQEEKYAEQAPNCNGAMCEWSRDVAKLTLLFSKEVQVQLL